LEKLMFKIKLIKERGESRSGAGFTRIGKPIHVVCGLRGGFVSNNNCAYS
jgi:hypothetical protein